MRRLRLAVSLFLASVLLLTGQAPASAAVWSTTAQWGTWTSGAYTLYNNIWGGGAGPQTLWVNSAGNWGVWADHPNTGGVKSYPNASITVNKRLSALGATTSSFNVTVPNSGSYATAYDIWADGHTYEIMLWMNRTGAVGPIGTLQANATVGGHSWAVYRGSNGSNAVFSFIRTSNTNAGTVDIRAVLRWIHDRGWYGDVTLSQIQFGYEITSSSGGLNFVTNSYSASSS